MMISAVPPNFDAFLYGAAAAYIILEVLFCILLAFISGGLAVAARFAAIIARIAVMGMKVTAVNKRIASGARAVSAYIDSLKVIESSLKQLKAIGANTRRIKLKGQKASGSTGETLVIERKVFPNNPKGATFEGGLYRSVPEGRNPLEIHPVFNTEKAIHRYTGEGQGGLYLGSSQRIVNSEFTGNGASIEGLMNNHYNVKIDSLLDLTNPSVRSELGVSLDDLVRTGGSKEWRYEITNPLGRYAEDSGYNGIIAPATQADGGVNVILFNPNLVK